MNVLKVLFVCSRNQWRSPTAEKVFSNRADLEVRSGGLSPKSSRKVSAADLEWADVVFVMEKEHKVRILEQFREPSTLPPLISLDIPDDYQFMDPELVKMLLEEVEPLLIEFRSKHTWDET